MSAQQTEILGRCSLITQLTLGGVEVAVPERDNGVDLIAYIDRKPGGFCAAPIQMKAATAEAFSIDRKYAAIPGLVMAFVWNAGQPAESLVHALTYAEALGIADEQGWTTSESWTGQGRWSVSKPSMALREALQPFQMSPGDWPRKVRHASRDREARGVPSTWLADAAGSFVVEDQWRADAGEWFFVAEPTPVETILDAVGRVVTLVVASHTEGLGPKQLTGTVVGLADVMTRAVHGRLRPFPAVELRANARRVVIPLNLIEAVRTGAAAGLDLPDAFEFSGLTPDDDVSGTDYTALYPH